MNALARLVIRLGTPLGATSGWLPFRPGVEIYPLWGDPKEGPSVVLLRYEPGARVPAHRHVGFEVIYVLEGAQRDERGRYGAGTIVVNPAGDEHSVTSEEGCVVLIVWERPTQFV